MLDSCGQAPQDLVRAARIAEHQFTNYLHVLRHSGLDEKLRRQDMHNNDDAIRAFMLFMR